MKKIPTKVIYGQVSISESKLKEVAPDIGAFFQAQMERFEADNVEFISKYLKQLFTEEKEGGKNGI